MNNKAGELLANENLHKPLSKRTAKVSLCHNVASGFTLTLTLSLEGRGNK